MKNIKLFEEHSYYSQYIGGSSLLPNVSHCITQGEIHYNPYNAPLSITFNVQDASTPTRIYYYGQGPDDEPMAGVNFFDKITIDGEEVSIAEIDAANGTISMSSGEHVVDYFLKNPSILGIDADMNDAMEMSQEEIAALVQGMGPVFMNCMNAVSVTIPNCVTTVGYGAFGAMYGLESVTVGKGVSTVRDGAFFEVSGLEYLELHCKNVGGWFANIPVVDIVIGDEVMRIVNDAFEDGGMTEEERAAIEAINPNAIKASYWIRAVFPSNATKAYLGMARATQYKLDGSDAAIANADIIYERDDRN